MITFGREFITRHLHKDLNKKTFTNNQIRAKEVRLIDEKGNQLGIVDIKKALETAKERSLDLIQITEKAVPPVCKIGDYGKFLYSKQKKDKTKQKKSSEIKGIRLGFNISQHDLETRAKNAEKFLKKGDKIRIEIILRGRQRGLIPVAKNKMNEFKEILEKTIEVKIEKELKNANRLIMIISKK